jgi:hypothetical protein
VLKSLFIQNAIASLLIIAVCNTSLAADLVSLWDPSSGLKPDEISEPYELIDNFTTPPYLESGKLIISNTSPSNIQLYIQREPLVDPSVPFSVTVNMKLVSGVSSSEYRAPAAIVFTIAPSRGIILWIDIDRVFFGKDRFVNGPVANVDTDEAMHAYRIEHDGDGNFTLFHDDVEILTGSAFESTPDHGPVRRFAFGDVTNASYGVSEWGAVSHNFINPVFRDSFETQAEQ